MTRNAESHLQASIVAYLRAVLPGWQVYAVFNGGDLTSKAEAAKRKWVGLKAGIPDVKIEGPDGFCGRMEIKTKAGSLSSAQRDYRDWCKDNGHHWALVRSIDDAREALRAWGIQSREAA